MHTVLSVLWRMVYRQSFATRVGDKIDMDVDIKGMRVKYNEEEDAFLEEDLCSKEPIGQFREWFEDACKCEDIVEVNAMTLATATKDGIPSARCVLLKGFGKDGFKFFTNYNSRKSAELDENPHCALMFYWGEIHRCVRIEGTAEKLSAKESDDYFQTRPRPSQIGACVSNQSQLVTSRKVLVDKEGELVEKYAGKPVFRPTNWGGYIVNPTSVEFWQGQSNRIHDRIRFRRPKPGEVVDNVLTKMGEDGWVYERLQP